jgi:hypothetical protein
LAKNKNVKKKKQVKVVAPVATPSKNKQAPKKKK